VGPFFIDSNLNQTKYHEIPLAVFHQDGAISHNARMNFVFLNYLNHFGEHEWVLMELFDGPLDPQI
jgi:hypothetical protein